MFECYQRTENVQTKVYYKKFDRIIIHWSSEEQWTEDFAAATEEEKEVLVEELINATINKHFPVYR